MTAIPLPSPLRDPVRALAVVTLAEMRAVVSIANAAWCVGFSFGLASTGVAATVAGGGGQASRRV